MDTLNDLLWTNEEDDLITIQGVKPNEIEYFLCTEGPDPPITCGIC